MILHRLDRLNLRWLAVRCYPENDRDYTRGSAFVADLEARKEHGLFSKAD